MGLLSVRTVAGAIVGAAAAGTLPSFIEACGVAGPRLFPAHRCTMTGLVGLECLTYIYVHFPQ